MTKELYEKIRNDWIKARKEKDKVLSNFLSTLISDIDNSAKNDNNRDVNDDDVINVVNKFIKNINETLLYNENENSRRELNYLLSVKPEDLSDDFIKEIIKEKLDENGYNKKTTGIIMKFLKENYNGKFDPKNVDNMINNYLNG